MSRGFGIEYFQLTASKKIIYRKLLAGAKTNLKMIPMLVVDTVN
jgi:hypothetical protein